MTAADEPGGGGRVSVVIAAFNAAGTLEAAIQSCVGQSLRPFEIIVVDDASRDGTADRAQALLSGIVSAACIGHRLIRHERNEGPSRARNDGWNAAAGDWIAFLDADDTWHPSKLETSLRVAEAHPEAQLIAHAFAVAGRTQGGEPWPPLSASLPAVRRLSFWGLLLYNMVATPTVLVARAVTDRFSETMRHNEDHELWLRIAASHPVCYYGWPLARLGRPLLTPGGASAALWRMRIGEMTMYLHVARHRRSVIPLIPLLLIWSMAKFAGMCAILRVRGSVPHVAWKES